MSYHGIHIHVIFSTQYRARLLAKSWREDLFAIIGDQIREHKGVLLQAGGIEDHVHLLIKVHPSFAIADTIRQLKSNSSQWINETRRIKGKFHWQTGYAAFSVSYSMVDVVKNYIVSQVEHHRQRTFKEEYLDFLKRHNLTFNTYFVFEEEVVA